MDQSVTNEDEKHSGLFYSTGEEVQLGDRVVMKRWIAKDVKGYVCYIPGISPRHREMEYEDVRQWAIRSEDGGAVYPILYAPAQFQPPKKIRFISRGPHVSMSPDQHLE